MDMRKLWQAKWGTLDHAGTLVPACLPTPAICPRQALTFKSFAWGKGMPTMITPRALPSAKSRPSDTCKKNAP